MPGQDRTTIEAAIARLAAAMLMELGGSSLERLTQFAELFLTWNQRINLGGDFGSSELIERHFLDSFVASRVIGRGQSVMDVGSGGGLPALPLAAIRPDLRLELYEPTGKKVAFLRTAVRELGLGGQVAVRSTRIEPEAPGAASADVAMSRATFAPPVWLELGLRLVRPGGSVLVYATGPDGWGARAAEKEELYAPGRRLVVFRR